MRNPNKPCVVGMPMRQCCVMKNHFIRHAFFIVLLIVSVLAVATEQTNPPKINQSETTAKTRNSLVNFSLDARIKEIIDGDTVTLESANKKRFIIRLSDIDTPETYHDAFTPRRCQCKTVPARYGQPGGKAATTALKKLLRIGDSVVAECYEMDAYNRMVCHIFKRGSNINLEMLENGWGWLPRNKQGKLINAWIKDPASYHAERAAKQNARGAWALPNQLSPSQWRRDCWNDGKCAGAEN